MEIIAHRGASHGAPENTLAAFHLAWAQGADAAECDVQLSRDGHVVVIHDVTTSRTAGKRRRVATQTLAELRQLDAGSWKAPRWRHERIPTLAEVLASVPEGKRLFIEIKSGPETVAPLAAEIRRGCWGRDSRAAIIGFDLQVMALSKRALPRVPAYWGLESRAGQDGSRHWALTTKEIIHLTKAAGLDGIDVDSQGPVEKSFAAEIHAAGLALFVWTVNKATTARRLAEAGVDGITTDRPGWLREALRRREKEKGPRRAAGL